jgi:hypothetical protein
VRAVVGARARELGPRWRREPLREGGERAQRGAAQLGVREQREAHDTSQHAAHRRLDLPLLRPLGRGLGGGGARGGHGGGAVAVDGGARRATRRQALAAHGRRQHGRCDAHEREQRRLERPPAAATSRHAMAGEGERCAHEAQHLARAQRVGGALPTLVHRVPAEAPKVLLVHLVHLGPVQHEPARVAVVGQRALPQQHLRRAWGRGLWCNGLAASSEWARGF